MNVSFGAPVKAMDLARRLSRATGVDLTLLVENDSKSSDPDSLVTRTILAHSGRFNVDDVIGGKEIFKVRYISPERYDPNFAGKDYEIVPISSDTLTEQMVDQEVANLHGRRVM